MTLRQGRCRTCEAMVPLTWSGMARTHAGKGGERCHGSGRKPLSETGRAEDGLSEDPAPRPASGIFSSLLPPGVASRYRANAQDAGMRLEEASGHLATLGMAFEDEFRPGARHAGLASQFNAGGFALRARRLQAEAEALAERARALAADLGFGEGE